MKSIDKKDGQDVPWLKNLTDCVNKMREEGYSEDFRVTDKGLSTYNDEKAYSPEEIKIVNFYRFEGVSDPGDMTVLYVIETNDGVKGTLSDGYGPYASEDVAQFIVEVEQIQKKINSSKLNA